MTPPRSKTTKALLSIPILCSALAACGPAAPPPGTGSSHFAADGPSRTSERDTEEHLRKQAVKEAEVREAAEEKAQAERIARETAEAKAEAQARASDPLNKLPPAERCAKRLADALTAARESGAAIAFEEPSRFLACKGPVQLLVACSGTDEADEFPSQTSGRAGDECRETPPK